MTSKDNVELLFLHALPLDGSMWAGQRHLLPGSTYTPTLYPFGDSIEAWAAAALKLAKNDRLVVVGCSVGGSCALELAVCSSNFSSDILVFPFGYKFFYCPYNLENDVNPEPNGLERRVT